MEERAGRYGVLPRSTVHRIVHRQTMPRDLPQFRAYLRACEVPESDWQEWETAWARAWRHKRHALDGPVDGVGEPLWFTAAPNHHRSVVVAPVRHSYFTPPSHSYFTPPKPAPPPQRMAAEGRLASRRQAEQQIAGQLSLPIGGGPDPDLPEPGTLFSLPADPVGPNGSKAA